jgi:hypothetical protein
MTFPSVLGTPRQTHVGSNSTTCDVLLTNGSNVVGNLVVLVGGKDGTGSITAPAGWENTGGGSSGTESAVIRRIIDGTEGFDGTNDSVQLSSDQLEKWTFTAITFDSWYGDLVDGFGQNEDGTGGGDNSPNPPSLTADWGSDDNYWIAFFVADSDHTVSGYPSGYTLNQHGDASDTGSGACTHGIAMKQNATATEDPGAFTMSGSDDWSAWTIAVRGTADDVIPPPPPTPPSDPGPASFTPPIPAGGFGARTEWPAMNPQNLPTQTNTFTSNRSISDRHIASVSARKISLVGIKVYRSTVQSINDDTLTNITYNAVAFRRDFKDPGASFTGVTMPYDGIYTCTAVIEYAADADGWRVMGFEIDGDGVNHDGCRLSATPTGVWRNSATMIRRFSAGQVLEMLTHHTAGAATNITAGEDNNSLTVIYQGLI